MNREYMNLSTFKTFCPLFMGFYNTILEYDGEEEDIQWYNEENGTDYNYDNFTWDYKEHNERVAKAFVNEMEKALKDFLPKLKMTYEKIVSPREYNFSTDSINIEVELDLKELMKLIRDREVAATEYFKDTYTSCDGFISFHSPYFEMWMDEDYILENPDHRIGALLTCLATIELSDDDIMYWGSDENYCDFSLNENVKEDNSQLPSTEK